MPAKRKLKLKTDKILTVLIFLLLGCGLIMLYSASTVLSFKNFGTTTHYIFHQLIFGVALGLIAMLVVSKVDYHFWQKYMPWLVGISLFLLAAVKLPGIGFANGGATRWLNLGPLSFQPSELAKLVIVLYLASWVDKRGRKINDFYFGLLPTLLVIFLFAGLILWQPDFGTMLVLIFVSMIMLFTGGINLAYFFAIILLGILISLAFIKFEPYRAQRLTTFLNPTADKLGSGYQINQALIAIGSGEWAGYGYGMSRQKYNYLPEAFSDSIFAVTAEELGFVREILILALFFTFALRGIKVARGAPDMFGKMTAIGIISWIIIQTLINIGAMVGLLPLTGIPLPFFSYGSSSLILTLAGLGILLNISKYSKA